MDISERVTEIREIIEAHNDRVINIIITQIDPDAIGSALGLAWIIKSFGGKSAIWYCGEISHHQNRAIANVYNLEKVITPISLLEITEESAFALVDSSLIDDARMGDFAGKIDPVIVIDHHRDGMSEESDKFIWVEDVGSACTMIVELIRQITEDCGEDVLDFPEYLAPLLQLGIYNDTRNLIFANSRDEESYFYISESVSSDEFSALVEYQVPKSFFLNSAASVTNAVTRDGCLVTNIGVIPPRQADDLAMIADRRIQQGDLTLVVVWGLIFSPEGNFVRFCARNDDLTSPLGDFLKECFGSGTGAKLMPGGQGSGGGVVNLDLGLFGSFIGLEKSDEKLIAYIKECMELVIFGSK